MMKCEPRRQFAIQSRSLWPAGRGLSPSCRANVSHGGTAFTVPLFDEFMRRIMPGDDWRQ